MALLETALNNIRDVAAVPSFSSYEERLHPYINRIAEEIPRLKQVDAPGNNLIYMIPGDGATGSSAVALSAHLDKINHYGRDHPGKLPVEVGEDFIEGAMDDSAGVGIILSLMQHSDQFRFPTLYIFFSEMEEKKGLKEHPELLRNGGQGLYSGLGAERIADTCLEQKLIPKLVVTVDTTPLFEGDPGVALYSRHWELNEIEPEEAEREETQEVVERFQAIDPNLELANNTNDYMHYGRLFNHDTGHTVPSVALEPAIYPYHQKGERVYIRDIKRVLQILTNFLEDR
ncbi:MAG: M28 family peptidase [Balneolaceae bacterium]|nr:M28 family peptidase [Balneolaceae bacterium]